MNLKECYALVNADYESVFLRLGNEEMIQRFLIRYFDKNEYSQLEKAVSDERWNDAFLYSHNMKGFALNLSLTVLAEKSSALCEALRGGKPQGDIKETLSDVKTAYEIIEKAVMDL